MELLVASNNQNKVREIRQILGDKFSKIYSLKDLNINVNADETADTFIGNALIKARSVREFTSLPVLADDSGLMVDALGGAPGVHSARYAGDGATDAQNNKLLLDNLKGASSRAAHFVAVVVLLFEDGSYICGEGSVDGEILTEKHGESGFGYDPLFYCGELGKTFAEATGEEKNSVSHRARALADLLGRL